jgi:lysophospholipase L1-like esterase
MFFVYVLVRNLMLIFPFLLYSGLAAQSLSIKDEVKFLALGDSYTIGQSVAASARWPAQLIDSIRAEGINASDARIIATTGWTTDNLELGITRADLSNDFNLVSLLIGVNDFYQRGTVEAYIPKFKGLLNTAVMLAGGDKSRVFVVSIPDYGFTPFGQSDRPAISAGIDAFNAANKIVTDEMGILYVDITDISRRGLDQPDLVAGDGLHPSAKQYTLWVRRILQNMEIESVEDDGDEEIITDVKEQAEPQLRISPNPSTELIRISNLRTNIRSVSFTLINLNGQSVHRKEQLRDDELNIDVDDFPSGVYVLSLYGDQRLISRTRIVKQ